jgi:hypothetical protein
MDRICKGVFDKTRRAWQEASDTARNLVQSFLVVEETNRLSCDGALRDPWILEGRPENSDNFAKDEVLIGCALTALRTLQRFQRLDRLKQVIMFICARVVSEAEFMDYALPVPWYRLFNALDTNSDGSIDYEEFVAGFKLLLGNKSDSNELEALARDLDLSCMGTISWTTWLAAALLSVDHVAQDDVSQTCPLESSRYAASTLDCGGGVGPREDVERASETTHRASLPHYVVAV